MAEEPVLPFTPVIIVGAGRSGTNILRDAICSLAEFATWDCDEINPIWRHGNMGRPHDRFTAQEARPEVRRFVKSAFKKEWVKQGKPPFLVEKTCASTLRLPFIDAIFPEVIYIHIYRHGGDVIASARKRWRGELEVDRTSYLLAKARATPLTDLPSYGLRYLQGRLPMIFGARDHLASWGPQSPAMIEMANEATLDERCARQWVDCVSIASDDLMNIEPSRQIEIRYEDLVADPLTTLTKITDLLKSGSNAPAITAAANLVRPAGQIKGWEVLNETGTTVCDIVEPALQRLGYTR